MSHTLYVNSQNLKTGLKSNKSSYLYARGGQKVLVPGEDIRLQPPDGPARSVDRTMYKPIRVGRITGVTKEKERDSKLETANVETKAANYTIRWMDEADIPAVARFVNECVELEPDVVDGATETEIREWFHNPINYGRNLLAFARTESGDEGPVIGNVEYNHSPGIDHAWAWMHVNPTYRLQGIGTALFDAVEKYRLENSKPSPTYTPNSHATLLTEFLERRGLSMSAGSGNCNYRQIQR